MLVSRNLLNLFLSKKLDSSQIIYGLDRAGIELEWHRHIPETNKKIVVGHVLEVDRHPDADRLRIAHVLTDSDNTPVQVVCGAPNLKQGQKVAVALPGATLPGGIKIKQAELRGQMSYGMICSEQELGIGSDHSGIMVLPESLAIGRPLCEYFAEDDLYDISTASNRPDLQSIIGIARELTVFTGVNLETKKFKPAQFSIKKEKGAFVNECLEFNVIKTTIASEKTDVDVLNRVRVFLIIHGYNIQHPVVDLTNFVMLTSGQPMHAYDSDMLGGSHFGVRFAEANEQIELINGKKTKLTADDLVVTSSNKVVALAGVMGGRATAAQDSTVNYHIEIARFDPIAVRQSALRHGLRTDASARYEKGITHYYSNSGLEHMLYWLGAVYPNHDTKATTVTASREPARENEFGAISFSLNDAENFLAVKVNKKTMLDGFEKLGIAVKQRGGKSTFSVTPPKWRTDLENRFDLFEEIMKIVGLSDVPERLPAMTPPRVSHLKGAGLWRFERKLRHLAAAVGYTEVNTYSFISEKQALLEGFKDSEENLRVKNRRSPEQMFIRRSLMPSLLQVAHNHRKKTEPIAVFETSRVAVGASTKTVPDENLVLATLIEAEEYTKVRRFLGEASRLMGIDFEYQSVNDDRFETEGSYSLIAGVKQIGLVGYIDKHISADWKVNSLIYVELNLTLLYEQQKDTISYSQNSTHEARDITLETRLPWHKIKTLVNKELSSGYQIYFVSEYMPLSNSERAVTLRVVQTSNDVKKSIDFTINRLVKQLNNNSEISIK